MPTVKINKKLDFSKAGEYWHHLIKILAVIFFLIWIAIGLFFLLTIYQQVRSGALSGVTGPNQAQNQAQIPTEETIPGVGTVNVACVQENLSQESIITLLNEGDINALEGEERTKLESCIVEPEAADEADS